MSTVEPPAGTTRDFQSIVEGVVGVSIVPDVDDLPWVTHWPSGEEGVYLYDPSPVDFSEAAWTAVTGATKPRLTQVTLGQPWPAGAVLQYTRDDVDVRFVPVDEGTHDELMSTWTYDLREVDR